LDHVEVPQSQHPLDLPILHDRSSELVSQEERQGPKTAKRYDLDAVRFEVFGERRAAAESMECIGTYTVT
jgi:hypothetical protein